MDDISRYDHATEVLDRVVVALEADTDAPLPAGLLEELEELAAYPWKVELLQAVLQQLVASLKVNDAANTALRQ